MPLTRRTFISGSAALLGIPRPAVATASDAALLLGLDAQQAWWALDLASGRQIGDNPDLRMPMCSSFKWLLAAMILSSVDQGREDLARRLPFGPADMLGNSPTTAAALAAAGSAQASLPIGDLCRATVTLSDNAAANLLLATIGGPAGLTGWCRTIGDATTRLDRREPALNRVPQGDPRDTTTPRATVGNLRRLLFDGGLTAPSAARLLGWLEGAKPGATRMPAGLRPGWRIGHKTGTYLPDPGDAVPRPALADVAVLLPATGRPVLVAGYAAGSSRLPADVDRWFAGLVQRATDPAWLRRN